MPLSFVYIESVIFGLVFGSFANVVIYRVPRGESVVSPPSHCTACGKRLSVLDLIPVISWLMLKGRCRYCGARISIRYPVTEATCAMLFFFMALYAGISLSLFPLCLFAFVLLCVSVIDAKTQEIPNGLLIFGAAVGAVWVGAGCFLPALDSPPLTDALPGILAGGLPLFVIDRLVLLLIKKDGFGFGDVKLMAMAGLYLGWELTLAAFFFAFIAGGGYGAFLLATRRAGRNEYIAFGPFLCAGALIALWFGESFFYVIGNCLIIAFITGAC